MTATQRRILGPLATALTTTNKPRWEELKGYIDRYDLRSTAVYEYAIPAFLPDSTRLVSELPTDSKRVLVEGAFTENTARGLAFLLIEEIVRRADVASRTSSK